MKTFDWGEYEMIECLDTNKPISFADEHGNYVLQKDAIKLEQQRDDLLAALKVADNMLFLEGYVEKSSVRQQNSAAIAKAEQ